MIEYFKKYTENEKAQNRTELTKEKTRPFWGVELIEEQNLQNSSI